MRPNSDPPQSSGAPLVMVLSGPSGVGKDAVLSELRKARPDIWFTVNATTRPPRPGEVDGENHIFVSKERFHEMVAQGELLEYAQVYTHWYGVPKIQVSEALDRGKDVVARVDIQGAASVRQKMPEALLVFIEPPSMAELERRLRERGTESHEQLALRIEEARLELKESSWFDYVVVNHTGGVQPTVARLLDILNTERSRIPPKRRSL